MASASTESTQAMLARLVQSSGYEPTEFEAEEDEGAGVAGVCGLPDSVVVVRRCATGEVRMYPNGPGFHWSAGLVQDLGRGYFGDTVYGDL